MSNGETWNDDQIKQAAALWREHVARNGKSKEDAYRIIAAHIDHSARGVEARYRRCGPHFAVSHAARPSRTYHFAHIQLEQRVEPSPIALAERDARINLAPQSTTAMLMGDPPPGRSALDQISACRQ